MAILSGTLVEVSPGIFQGATDFSEFGLIAPSGALPPGISLIGSGPTVFSVGHDPVEGFYFESSGHGTGNFFYYFAYDVFNALGSKKAIEFLARCWRGVEDPANSNDHFGGPGARVSATQWLRADSNYTFDPPVTEIGLQSGSSDSGPQTQARQENVWAWVRFRIDIFAALDFRARVWYGDLADEPATWDADVGVAFGSLIEGAGWSAQVNPSDDPQRWSFISFTTSDVQADVDNNPPLPPDEVVGVEQIAVPVLTVLPIQDTWVGLNGSPYEVL